MMSLDKWVDPPKVIPKIIIHDQCRRCFFMQTNLECYREASDPPKDSNAKCPLWLKTEGNDRIDNDQWSG